MTHYIDADKLKKAIEDKGLDCSFALKMERLDTLALIDSLQQESPDKETILRICKLHKVWSISAPWENVEDFVINNWNSKNIV